MVLRRSRIAVLAWVCTALSGCGDAVQAPTAPTATVPSPVVPESTKPQPPVPPTGAYTVSGTILERTSEGLRPGVGANVNAWIQTPRLGFSYWWAGGRTYADGQGHYELSNLPEGVTVQLQVWKDGFAQQCAAPRLMVSSSKVLDTELIATTALWVSPSQAPASALGFRVVSGIVYRQSATGLTPVAGAMVDFEPVMDFPAATTLSDEDGRYLLCGIPEDTGVQIGAAFQGRVGAATLPQGGDTDKADVILR